MNFTHLHVHTQYSLLDGSNKIEEYVARVKELGMDSAAITDHGAMYGCIDFYKAAKAAGIKPIMGCEVYVAPKSRFDREAGSQEDRYYHLVLLAENNVGYANLMKIVSKGFVEGFYYKPRVDLELLEKYHQGLIALSACLAGEVPRYLVRGMYQEAKEAALRYQQIFGEGNYFLELQDHGIPEQQTVNQQLMRLHQETGIELTATNDVHYTYAQDATAHDILLCIQTAKKLDDEDRMRYEGGQYYVKSPQEMAELFPYALEALENTHKIAMRCNVEIEFGVTKLPKYDVPQEYTSWEYLNKLCREGLERLYHPVTEELKDRLQYELDTISDMGFVDYFLIVWDFIKYARDHGISVGPGRGSAAGSLVSYTLGITRLDPIKYNLLFERFLNPERVSMPDIDIDFCFERRQEVIDYVVEKYGKDRVVQIVTFGTMAARGVIRDVGRVLDLPYVQVDTVAKMIPTELNITIDKAMERNPELAKTYREDDQIHNLIDMAKRLEGLPRHTSMHAAGVVISQKDIDEYVPLSRATDGSITTQFTMTTLEELGLLKMDFLGLRTLTVIQDTEKLVEKDIGICLDMDKIDYSDEKVLSSIGTGKTEGVFQLESAGMKNFMKELKPRSLEDVIAGIALYRPGPMDFIPQYIRGKNNAETVTYDCPQLKPILEATYGCIVYQEQVMQIVRELGGYTLGRSDLLRRAMSKKKAAVMEKERKSFVYGNEEDGIPGCIKNGIDEKIADKIYDDMIDFAKYAFNKSHAAAYAVVAYQTAYLKYYYPQQFMAALMTSVIDFPSKVSEYILHCRQIGIDILPPDVNSGGSRFSVDGTGIRYGMSAIKSVGKAVIDEIVAEREKNGLFTTLNHFITRMSGHEVNKRVVENLIKAGALDCLEGSRRQKMMIYTQIMDSVQHEKKNSMAGQMSLMDIVGEEEKKEFAISLPQVEDYDKETILSFEKEVLGIYISGHPLERYTKILAQNATAKTVDFLPDDDTGFPNLTDGKKVIIGGMITNKTLKYTRNNKVMAFLTVEDLVGTVEIIVFPRDYEKNVNRLEEDNKVFILGRVAAEDDKASKLICEKMWLFTEVPRELWVQFSSKEEYQEKEEQLAHALDVSRGTDSVVVFLKAERAMKRLPSGRNISIDSLDMERFCEKFGRENVKVLEKSIEKAVKMH
ncbi:MAG: DNA polymerase III subunit alpha [Lachnospiraceae bacterium]|nr:DNA polymerase III subunit alpha [Lachnospiraceae bacterium]